jgi:DNA repair photolyase
MRAEYREVTCRTGLNRVHGMPFRWSLNPYRGCVHRCQFCFASTTHQYLELGDSAAFFGIILVKTNLPEVLQEELGRRRRRELVAVGTATDPYQPAEGRYRLTRRCLELFARFRTPVSLVTKGTLVLRDIDVLQDLDRRGGVTVCLSIPTVDAEIWRRTELGTPPPWQRLKVLERLVAAGLHAGVLLAPLLPGLSATPEQITRTVRAAAERGACFIGSNLLHLDAGIRDYFLGFLEREYPELLDGYRRLYRTKYAPKAYQLCVERRIQEAKAMVGYGDDHHRRVETPREPLQLALPLLAR